MLGSYFNACNTIENQNRILKPEIVVKKYCVTQSGYFRLATEVSLVMGIVDGKILYCHVVAEVNADKMISTL